MLAPNTSDNDASSTYSKKSPYLLWIRNHSPNSDDDDSASPDDATFPDSLIYSKLKRKIHPRSIINLIFLNTVTDVDAAENNASHVAMNTAAHAPNSVTDPDA